MRDSIKRYLKRTKNQIKFKFKSKITDLSLESYKIVLFAIYHANKEMICDLKTGDILIFLEDLDYDIIITYNEVIITNHDFPNLGPVDYVVINRIREKAKDEISRCRQIRKNEILTNNKNLVITVREKVKASYIAALREERQKLLQ